MSRRTVALDETLHTAVAAGVPGVVALAATREGVIYQGAAGVRRLGAPEPMTADTVLALWSCTKAITTAAALQLWEQGALDLDAPAKTYAAEIAAIEVFDGFDAAGAPKFRAPRREITTRMLLLHTAGFSYDFLNADYLRLRNEHGIGDPRHGRKHSLNVPLIFEPGERWEYSRSLDWVGQVVEGVAGKTLDAVFAERIFAPLGMPSTAFVPTPEMEARRASMHEFDAEGRLRPTPLNPIKPPDAFMGGGALQGSAADFMRFLRAWLDDGGAILKPATVEYASRNHLGGVGVRVLRSLDPARSLDFDFVPGVEKSWALSFLRLEADTPSGRSAGSLSWGGLGNLYFWIDSKAGVTGFWAAQYLPFLHPWAVEGYEAFEREVYRRLKR